MKTRITFAYDNERNLWCPLYKNSKSQLNKCKETFNGYQFFTHIPSYLEKLENIYRLLCSEVSKQEDKHAKPGKK